MVGTNTGDLAYIITEAEKPSDGHLEVEVLEKPQACSNSSILEMDAGRSGIRRGTGDQGYSQLNRKFKASLEYRDPIIKNGTWMLVGI